MAEQKKTQSSGGVDPKLAVLLCWLLTPLTSIIFLLLEDTKKDEYVQFNAKQTLWFGVAHFLLNFLVIIPCLGAIVVMFGNIAFWIARIYFGIKAYNGERVELPIFADLAK